MAALQIKHNDKRHVVDCYAQERNGKRFGDSYAILVHAVTKAIWHHVIDSLSAIILLSKQYIIV